ncbi:hypothetical protein [Chitinophaga eiseniae]|uniref:DUF5655 domain-containing protein n=1 Tax=Chitinophaga eiseniae TaxID=634771 RepID=A0A847STS5_9BACT|nr:hypothetical protein [Chitinophaga eiseniae]NLR80969.1 hypothetical protein [Chitinophaga eiseniae]
MSSSLLDTTHDPLLTAFLTGKSEQALSLLRHFLQQYQQLGNVYLYPTKSMIGIGIGDRRVAWVNQLGKAFINVVFPFETPHPDNLCFTRIAQVPGDAHQFNHHFRMILPEDVNDEVLQFMRLSLQPV